MAKRATAVEVVMPKIKNVDIPIQGITPLLCNRMSERSIMQMENKQQKKGNAAKEARDPEKEFQESAYLLDDTKPLDSQERYGFPAISFKSAAVAACRHVDGIPMTKARGMFNVMSEMLPLHFSEVKMRSDRVVLETGVASIAYRAEFHGWTIELPISYNSEAYSLDQICTLLAVAGFAVGVGSWRPDKSGVHGQFEIAPPK